MLHLKISVTKIAQYSKWSSLFIYSGKVVSESLFHAVNSEAADATCIGMYSEITCELSFDISGIGRP